MSGNNNVGSSESNMEQNLHIHKHRRKVKGLKGKDKRDFIDEILQKHKNKDNAIEEIKLYFGNDISDELTAHHKKMSENPGRVSPMIPINYARKNGGKKGKTQRKNKKSKKSKTQRKIKKTKKSKTRKSTRRRR